MSGASSTAARPESGVAEQPRAGLVDVLRLFGGKGET